MGIEEKQRLPVAARERHATALFLLLLALLEYLVFSDSFSEFFQGDALFYMAHRFRSWGEFFHALYTLDVANWYRPLASQTIPSVFFPWFGMDAYGYHWVVFLLFFGTTCLLFQFIRRLTASFAAAAAGTVFFAIHSINVYVTYDFAFAPELLYASFYLLSCIAFHRSEGSHKRYALSLVFFVMALMSKEAAVTLPGNIVLLTLLMRGKRDWKRVLPFFGIMGAYYLYIVRFLKVGAGDYALGLHKDLFPRVGDSLLWAFDMQSGRSPIAVALAAAFVIGYAIISLAGARRRYTLFGACWFFVALSPMLGIVGYFGPYYLFLPLAGIAIIAGECFAWLYFRISLFNRGIAFAAVCLGLTPFTVAARLNAQAELHTNTALGYAGRIAADSARDLKRFHPAIPPGATLYIVNPDEPRLTRFYGISALFKLVYADDTIDVRYSSLGHAVPENAIVMRYAEGGLVPEAAGKPRPAQSQEEFRYETTDRFSLDVFPARVAAGKGAYSIRISGAANTDAELQYRFNDGPVAFLTVHLNRNGETGFFVSDETKRGTYRFIGMRIPPDTAWMRAEGSVTVTDP